MVNPNSVLAPVNHGGLDPFQGYDADVYVLNQINGNYILVGKFVSIQIIVDNLLEPYLGINKRMPKYLDGEINISWQMERGQLDTRVLEQTFGYKNLSQTMYVDKMPLFQISFLVSAEGLDSQLSGSTVKERHSSGEMVLSYCKVKRFTLAGAAGKSVIANRWEGTAEGISFLSRDTNTLASSNTTLDNNSSFGTVNSMFASWYQSTSTNTFHWNL